MLGQKGAEVVTVRPGAVAVDRQRDLGRIVRMPTVGGQRIAAHIRPVPGIVTAGKCEDLVAVGVVGDRAVREVGSLQATFRAMHPGVDGQGLQFGL